MKIKKNLWGGIILGMTVIHFWMAPKDNVVDHSRELSLQTSIEAFHEGLPLHLSNQHIYRILGKLDPGYKKMYALRPNYEPIETTWEDPGYFYFAYYFGKVKNLLGLGPVKFSDLHLAQFLCVFILSVFVLMSISFLNPFFYLVFFVQLLSIFLSGSYDYQMLGYYTYPLVAVFLFYLALIWARFWSEPRSMGVGYLAIVLIVPMMIKIFRADAGMIAQAVSVALLLSLAWKSKKKVLSVIQKKPWVVAIPVVLFLVPISLQQLALMDRKSAAPQTVQQLDRFIGGHPFWISAFTGLGYLPNSLGFEVRDEAAIASVIKRFGIVEYMTQDFEESLRKIIIEGVSKDPFYVLRLNAKKTFDLLIARHPPVPKASVHFIYRVLAILGFLHLVVSAIRIRNRRGHPFYLVSIGICVVLAAPIYLREPYMPYSMMIYNFLFCYILARLLLLSDEVGLIRRFFQPKIKQLEFL